MSRLETCTGETNGTSKENHGGKSKALGGAGQGSVLSGVERGGASYAVLRRLEKKKI